MSGPTSSGARSGAFGSFVSSTFSSGDNATITTYVLPDNIPDVTEVPAISVWNVPRPPSQLFVGRGQELELLHEVLSDGTGVIGQTVKGLGGVGKSELALQYASARRAEFASVWWLTADTPANLTNDLAEIAYSLVPALRAVSPEVAAQWALNWLQAHPGWLAVLDNVEQPEHIDAFLGRARGSHVLVTTRRDIDVEWRHRGLRSVRLGSLPEDQAILFLLDATEQRDRRAAGSVAVTLGGLPLALEQAAAYVTAMEITLAEYANRLAQEPEEAFEYGGQERAINKVWRLTLRALQEKAPEAVALLDALAWLGPDNLPRELVTDYTGGDRRAADRMLAALKSYSMITLTDEFVSVHRLVQAVLRLAQTERTETGIAPAAESAIEMLGAAMPDNPEEDIDGWPRWSALLPHAHALGAQVGGGNRSIELSLLLNQAGLYASVQGMYSATVALAELALQIGRAVMAPDDPTLATLLGNLGAAHHAAGHPDLSADLEEQALAIAERAYGADDPRVALLLSNLAGSYNSLGRPHDAVALHLRALRICEESTGKDSPDVARSLANLAAVYTELGQTADAVPLEERALQLTLKHYGPDHILVAYRMSALAASYRELGSPDRALTLNQRAVAIGELQLRDSHTHPDMASFYGGLAASHSALDEDEKALPLREKALAIVRAAFPEKDHPDIAVALDNLASTYQTLGRVAEAAAFEEEALAITSASRGEQHPDTAARMGSLASTYRILDRADEALELDRKSLEITQRAFGRDHRDVATRLGSMASSLMNLGRPEGAIPLLLRAIKISTETYGDKHLDIAIWSERLGRAYRRSGRYEEAADAYQTAVLVSQEALHRDHPDVARQLANRAVVLNELGRRREALPLLRRALWIEEMTYGREGTELLDRLDQLVNTYDDEGDETRAAVYQRRYLGIAITVYGPESAEVADAHGRLGHLLYRLGQYAEAIPHEQAALEITDLRLPAAVRDRRIVLRLENLAASYNRDNRPAEALPLLERAAEIAEQRADPEKLAWVYARLGGTLFALGRYAEAAPYEKRAAADTTDPVLRLDRLDSLAYTYDAIGDYAALSDVRQTALELARSGGADDADLAGRYADLADACLGQDDHDGAEQARRAAIDLLTGPELAQAWERLSATLTDAERHEEAEAAALTAVEIGEREMGPDDGRMVRLLESLALPLRELGRYPEALQAQRRALAVAEGAYGVSSLPVAHQLSLLGNTYFRLHQPGNSIPLEQRALAIAEERLADDDQRLLLYLRNLAESYRVHGRPAEAVPLLRRALDVARRSLPPGDPEITIVEDDLEQAETKR
jgi:tetratricopeptide (TPR) repeat protein